MEADNAVRVLRGPGGGVDLGLSSDSLEDSDTDSLCEERRYQSELQNRLHSNHEVILQTKGGAGEPQGEVMAEDLSHQGKGAKANTRPQEIHTSYPELRYDPDWRKHQNLLLTSDRDEEEFLDVSSTDSEQFSPDELTPGPSEDGDSGDGHRFWKPLTDVPPMNKKNPATTKPKSKESHQITKQGTHSGATERKTAPQEASKKDIIEKNKVTFGVRKEKPQSYLHMHRKKIEESKSGQRNEKSDVQPVEDGSYLGKEMKLPGDVEKSGLAHSHIQEKTPNTLNMTGADLHDSQWDKMAVFSAQYDPEYMTISSYPDGYRDPLRGLVDPYSSQELLQIYNEESYYQNIRPPEMRYGHHMMETIGDMYMYHRSQSHPDPPGIAYNTHNDVFTPSQMPPQTYLPMATTSNSKPEAGTRDKSSNDRTRLCPSGARKTAAKHQKRMKSFLNQEVKLGGLGPVHSVSEEKKEQLKQQKEYAKAIHERNRSKPTKPREIQITDKNKSTRQKSLEYAKNVPRPQPVPKVSSETKTDAPETRATSYDSLFPQMKLLEDLQIRHEKEKMAVAALSALHIL